MAGAFLEIEIRDEADAVDEAALAAECAAWRERLGVADAESVAGSYADLLTA